MASRSLPGLVLEEAADVLGELRTWLRLVDACPKCGALQGCSHEAGCPLGRVARLRCLLGAEDQSRRDDELVALRRERGERGTSEENLPFPSARASAGTVANTAVELPRMTPVAFERVEPTARVVRSAPLLVLRDEERCVRPDARGLDPAAPIWRLLLLASEPARERTPWPSLARLKRATRHTRRSVIRLVRDLQARGILTPARVAPPQTRPVRDENA
jgi:hypothetical protein